MLLPVRTDKGLLAVLEISNYSIDNGVDETSQSVLQGIARSLALTLENIESEENSRLSVIGAMAATIVHDLKNPIGAILGYADMAKEKEATESEREEYLDVISKEATRMSAMAHEVLEFSRGELVLDLSEAVSDDFLSDINSTLLPIFQVADIELSSSVNYHGVMSLDQDRIRRVILNLVNNARDAMVAHKSSATAPLAFNLSIDQTETGGAYICYR